MINYLSLSLLCATVSLFLFVVQVVLLLYMCQILIYWMWSRGTDPDNAAIPYLTAVSIVFDPDNAAISST